ncbi:ABC transporter permease [Planosporangium mesophilum]|uniref:Putative dipeptide-transport integral membrane protein ABC transporter DppB n=1 Tax=Planosporangium mesophilum TaxID=689768 RepID=A0A8J3TG48_9ACTN|nr:ABC transporter permease [Planosporangium mesophilum]NJC81463.1 ABC transporter permease [Planosporangium mesophilum]GII20880.1 putative dipeptide-transport integral membrane protein ABC transporter DppB [Planosporangium mesophilum]
MGRYLARRLLQFVPTLLGALFILHYLMTVGIQLNGDPARAVFGDRTPSQSQLQAMQRVFGTDDPCFEQAGNPCLTVFVHRLENMAQGDFGVDSRERPVVTLIAEHAPITARLALLAILIELLVGVTAGVLAGLRGGSFWDYVVKVSTTMLVAIPIFVVGAVTQLVLGVEFGSWLKGVGAPDLLTGLFSIAYRTDQPWASLVMPAFVLASLSLATTARLTRTSLMENLRGDYVRTATAKGLTRNRVVGVHALRNSLIPVITNLGISFGNLLAGAVVTEGIFNIRGIGGLVFGAVATGEAATVVSVVTILVLVYLLCNLIIDVLYAVLDPRIRLD